MYKIAVLMTVHNRCQQTLRCLESLKSQKLGDFSIEIFLTDDGCTDNTAQQVRTCYQKVHIIEGDGTLYWNRGMLAAFRAASQMNPNYYLWLNDDTLLIDDAVIRLLAASASCNNQSIIVGSTFGNDGKITYGGRQDDKKHTIIEPQSERCVACKTFNGNIVLIPSYVYDRIGYNDSYYHHSFGDIDYGLKATKQGLTNYIAPGFYGKCERNNPVPLFRRRQYPLIKRYKLLYSPLGFNPLEDFHLNRQYSPLWKAIFWFLKLHINVLFTKDHIKY